MVGEGVPLDRAVKRYVAQQDRVFGSRLDSKKTIGAGRRRPRPDLPAEGNEGRKKPPALAAPHGVVDRQLCRANQNENATAPPVARGACHVPSAAPSGQPIAVEQVSHVPSRYQDGRTLELQTNLGERCLNVWPAECNLQFQIRFRSLYPFPH